MSIWARVPPKSAPIVNGAPSAGTASSNRFLRIHGVAFSGSVSGTTGSTGDFSQATSATSAAANQRKRLLIIFVLLHDAVGIASERIDRIDRETACGGAVQEIRLQIQRTGPAQRCFIKFHNSTVLTDTIKKAGPSFRGPADLGTRISPLPAPGRRTRR